MSLVSIGTVLFFLITFIVYYVVPKKWQWMVLLAASLVFYVLSAPVYTLLYVLVSLVSVYVATAQIEKGHAPGQFYLGALFLNVGILVALKYMNFLLGNVGTVLMWLGVTQSVRQVNWFASLGVSFYTLQMVGYLTDVYWGISKRQNNFAKLALFNCYFPQMISGPISRYGQLEGELFGEHQFDAGRVRAGAFRIVLGILKKLVVAEQLIAPTEAIFADTATYSGFWLWLGMGLYVVRIYADFSGCMDMVLGASTCLGIQMPENFRRPFSSSSIQEFWQRWHITLGTWLKDYIMYPLLRTNAMGRFTKWTKKKWGKNVSKKLPTYLAMLVLWLAMGLWHGGGWNFLMEGVWFWLTIVLGQLLEPLFKNKKEKTVATAEKRSLTVFRKIRTAVLFAIGILFFRSASVAEAFGILASALHPMELVRSVQNLPTVWQMLDLNVGTVRTAWGAFGVLYGLTMMCIASRASGDGERIEWQERLAATSGKQKFLWYVALYVVLLSILLLGAYGPGYSASEFIYGGF